MARSIEEIYNGMIAEKQSLTQLNGFLPTYNLVGLTPDNPVFLLLQKISTKSKVAIWKLVLWIVATAIYTHEVLWDNFKIEVQNVANSSKAGTLQWYADQVLSFQYGFGLVFNPNIYRYSYTDIVSQTAADARIVKKVSVNEVMSGGQTAIAIKVAKSNSGVLEPLDDSVGGELDALKVYINRFKFAGVNTVVTSLNPDLARLNLKVFYDGVLDLAQLKTTVELAIKAYFNAIEFDGVFYTNKLIDALQLVQGIKDIYVNSSEFQPYGGSFAAISGQYAPASGYFELVPIGTTGADTLIEYVAV